MYFFSQWEPTDAAGCRDAFIYEYVGDVVSNPSFIKRMREYAEEGIKHFYFMMLQKDEVSVPVPPPPLLTIHQPFLPLPPLRVVFSSSTRQSAVASVGSRTIPATQTATSQSGQSDNTSEWASSRTARSRRTRSSLSTITSIATGEFATPPPPSPQGGFCRGTDNYFCRHDAQPCYCGEAKCVGFIGGKTQTDLAGMDDLYLDGALVCSSIFVYRLLNAPSSQRLESRTRSTDSGSRGARRRGARSWMRIGW